MAVIQLPTFDDPFYEYVLALEGTDYLFRFRFVQRENTWSLSLYLPDETPISTGIKIVCKQDLLWRSRDVRAPKGLLVAIANDDDGTPPELTELGIGKRVTLTYFTTDEIPNILA